MLFRSEKLPVSDGLRGGYLADGVTPGPLLTRALDYINDSVARMREAIADRHLQDSTTIILSAKHGQSPQNPAQLTRINDGTILTALDTAWQTAHPTDTTPLVAFAVDDDGMLIWLNDRSAAATSFARTFLLAQSGIGNDINGSPKAYMRSGLRTVYAGEAAADFMHVKPGDPRVPDVIGIAQVGSVYTGKMAKIAEHGGDNPDDRDVALVVSGGSVDTHEVEIGTVETTQIAPTILSLLGIDPRSLQAVRIEGTAPLPVG